MTYLSQFILHVAAIGDIVDGTDTTHDFNFFSVVYEWPKDVSFLKYLNFLTVFDFRCNYHHVYEYLSLCYCTTVDLFLLSEVIHISFLTLHTAIKHMIFLKFEGSINVIIF